MMLKIYNIDIYDTELPFCILTEFIIVIVSLTDYYNEVELDSLLNISIL